VDTERPETGDDTRPPSAVRRVRLRFRAWRRSRPFWGGVIALLAAGEFLLPDLAPVSIFLIQGIGAVATAAIIVLIAAMVLLTWFNPGLHQPIGVIVVVLALASFPLSNLGGFLLGMLLALVGGSMIFAWVPRRIPRKKRRPVDGPAPTVVLALILTAAATVAAGYGGAAAAAPTPTPSPSPSLPPSPSATASPSPVPSPSGSGSPSPSASPPESPSPSASASPSGGVSIHGTVVAAHPSEVTADTMTVVDMVDRGTAVLKTATGSVRALWIEADSVTLAPFHQVSDLVPGTGLDTDNPTGAAVLSGHVTLYLTELTGTVLGVPVDYTPDAPPPVSHVPRLVVDGATVTDAFLSCDLLRLPALAQHPTT
jgi:uncharacterized protein DUF6114